MGAWGRNIAFEILQVSVGICFMGSGYSGIEMRVGVPVETWHVLVGGRFRGSCFVACNFWPAKTNVRPSLKHYMFPCWFTSELAETWHVLVGGRFWGSCFVACNFRPAKTNVKLSLKHDMFPCWFTPELAWHVCGKLCCLKASDAFTTCWNNVEVYYTKNYTHKKY
jgi:hypothetical protein